MNNQPDKPTKTPPPDNPRETPENAYGKVIEHYRTRLELSQEEFSKACDLGRNAIGEYETGKRKKPQRDTIKRIVAGICALGLEITIEEFDAKVAEFQKPKPQEIPGNYVDPKYEPEASVGQQDLARIKTHIPAAREIVSDLSLKNSEFRFTRGMTNALNRIEKMACRSGAFDLEGFSTLMKQFDSYVQELERKNLHEESHIFSLKGLRQSLGGFEDELGEIYSEYKDGLIPNDWPSENIKHQQHVERLFAEIQQLKLEIEGVNDPDFCDKAIDTLEELEIELDRNPLHLKNINAIRERLEALKKDSFKELLIDCQLLLGTYAEQLPPGAVFRDGRHFPEMVVIPAGSFWMGSEDYEYEQPIHEVTITNRFAVGRFSVTFAEYDHYCDVTGAGKPDAEGWGRDRRPVINVSWDDTQKYLKWLNGTVGEEHGFYCLLSEAQWEYACRAGSDARYSFGDDESQLTDYAWYDQNSNNKTHPAGKKKPNDFGLYDMHGNVYDWVQDHYHKSYEHAPEAGSAWLDDDAEKDDQRVLRGGSWLNSPQVLRSALRDWSSPDDRFSDFGFRVTRTL